MTKQEYTILDLLTDCAEMGAARVLKSLQPKSDDLTQNQAYKKFGEAWVDRCFREGLIKRRRKGKARNSPVYYSNAELLALRATLKASAYRLLENEIK